MKTVRIYGFIKGYGSYAQVTRGFHEAFSRAGRTAGELDLVGLEEEPSFDEEPQGLPLADVAVLTGPPVAARQLHPSKHAVRCVMVAPNSDRLPEKTMAVVQEHATHVLSPSMWGAEVIARYTDRPVIVVPHGIDRAFVPPAGGSASDETLEALYEKGEFRVLHLSSTEGQRKGTLELCEAFRLATNAGQLPEASVLELVLTPAARGAVMDRLAHTEARGRLGRGRLVLRDRLNLQGASPAELATEIYPSVHLVCQPSRGEGFGLVPLEALATGTPIAVTSCTGHRQWVSSLRGGARLIPTGKMEPIDDLPGALAPAVAAEDIASALSDAYRHWHEWKAQALAWAPLLGERWSWSKQLEGFVEWSNQT